MTVINISCGKQDVYSHFHELENAEWNQSDTLVFDIDSTRIELNVPYTVDIEVTNNVNYPYRNIWFFVQTNFENDSTFVTTEKEYQLADEFGKWNGTGFGTLFQITFPYDKVVFKERKNYRIKLEHGMRDNLLRGVEKIGVSLSKSE